jgi:glycosyltransferase involved in cell wall biosynthesis
MEKYAVNTSAESESLMSNKIWIDLTDISGWTGNFTGIQRVVYNLAYYFYKNNEASFFRYDENKRSFYEADFGEVIKRFNEAAKKDQAVAVLPKNFRNVAYATYARLPNNVKLAMPKKARLTAKKSYRALRKAKQRLATYRLNVPIPIGDEKALFAKNDTVIVFGNNWDRAIFIDDLSSLKIKSGFKVYQLVYDLIPILGPQLFGIELFAIYSKYLFEVVAVSDGLLCISKSTEADLISFCSKVGLPIPKTKVIRLGDSLEKTKSKELKKFKEVPYVLCVGTLEVRKNHTLLYYAWKEAARQNIPMPQLIIVGRPGWHTDNIRHTIKYDLEVGDKITILENVSDAELRWLYENCLFSVYPSMYEGWGLPIAESLSYGKLCLSANTSSMPEIAGDTIDYFSPYSSGECMDKISEYYHDPEKLKAKENSIKKFYKTTSWSYTYEEVKSFVIID